MMELFFQLEFYAYPSTVVDPKDLDVFLKVPALESLLSQVDAIHDPENPQVKAVNSAQEVITSLLSIPTLGVYQLRDKPGHLVAELVKYKTGFGLWIRRAVEPVATMLLSYRNWRNILQETSLELGDRYELGADTGISVLGLEYEELAGGEIVEVLDRFGWYQLLDTIWAQKVPWESEELEGEEQVLRLRMASLPPGVDYWVGNRLLFVDWFSGSNPSLDSLLDVLRQRAQWLSQEMTANPKENKLW